MKWHSEILCGSREEKIRCLDDPQLEALAAVAGRLLKFRPEERLSTKKALEMVMDTLPEEHD
jgi:hypothetical protein